MSVDPIDQAAARYDIENRKMRAFPLRRAELQLVEAARLFRSAGEIDDAETCQRLARRAAAKRRREMAR